MDTAARERADELLYRTSSDRLSDPIRRESVGRAQAVARDSKALADEVDRLQATLTALENAAACYRANLREILGECSHDKPRVDKIRGYAEQAIRGADYWLAAPASRPEPPGGPPGFAAALREIRERCGDTTCTAHSFILDVARICDKALEGVSPSRTQQGDREGGSS